MLEWNFRWHILYMNESKTHDSIGHKQKSTVIQQWWLSEMKSRMIVIELITINDLIHSTYANQPVKYIHSAQNTHIKYQLSLKIKRSKLVATV